MSPKKDQATPENRPLRKPVPALVMDLEGVAEALSISVSTVQELVRREEFPAPRLLYIDPSIQPAPGRMVVVGDCLELWAGQAHVRGVLAAVFTDEDDRNEGGQS